MSVNAAERGSRGGPIGHCPECASDELYAVSNGFETNFRCSACGRCWHVSLGRVSPVDPVSCPGCEQARECRGHLTRLAPIRS
jgi:hypothetical protein